MHAIQAAGEDAMKRAGERGIVLLAVLLAVAIMSVMVVAVTTLTRAGISGQRLEDRLLASRIALHSGLEAGKALIAATPAEQRVLFDGTPVEMDLGQGIRAQVMIRDVAGFADVNRADMKLLAAILGSALKPEVAKNLTALIEEMRKKAAGPGEDQAKGNPPMPEDPAPEGQQKPPPSPGVSAEPPANPADPEGKPKPLPVVFLTVDQALGMVPADAVTDTEAQSLSASLTVFNPTPRVNPFAAPKALLQAVPGLTPQDIAAIDEARKNRALKGNARIEQILERLKPYLTTEEPSVFMIGVRLIEGPGIIAQSSAGAIVQPLEGGPLPFRTLSVSGL